MVSIEIFQRGAILIASIEGANNFFEEFDKDFSATNSGFSYGSSLTLKDCDPSTIVAPQRSRTYFYRDHGRRSFSATILNSTRSGTLLSISHRRKVKIFKVQKSLKILQMKVPEMLHRSKESMGLQSRL